nr:hypothetical protein [uncultured Duganella sp.]
MRYKVSALLDPQGRVLGQVMQWRCYAVAPLHVLAPAASSSMTLLDADSTVRRIAGVHLLAIDRAADLLLLRLPAWAAGTEADALPAPAASTADFLAGAMVEIDAVFHGCAPADGWRSRRATVRRLVLARQHQYRAASGEHIAVQQVQVLFLSAPLSAGWSGAPVRLAAGGAVLGFIHGNAAANGDAAVCLLAGSDSPVLHLASEAGDAAR